MPDTVDLVRRDAGRDGSTGSLEGLSRDPTCDPHLLDRLGGLDVPSRVVSRPRLADVLRSGDRRGHCAARGDGGSGEYSHMSQCSSGYIGHGEGNLCVSTKAEPQQRRR
jgi:hypothetical protein